MFEVVQPVPFVQRVAERVEERPVSVGRQHVGHGPLEQRPPAPDPLEQEHHALELQVGRRHL